MNVSLIGLGKLGLPLAACLADGGNKVLGIDKNEVVIDLLSRNIAPFYEEGLSHLIQNDNFIGFTTSYKRAIEETSCTIILVNTQMGKDGYSCSYVDSAVCDLAINLKNHYKGYHLIILSSTVLPGNCSRLIKLMESISNLQYQKDFGFAFVPDFVKLGSVIHDFRNPEFFLVGCESAADFSTICDMWGKVHANNPSTHQLSLNEAEIAKIALNAYIVNKITFANFLGILCRKCENVDVHKITDVIGLDKRISPYFFKSGTPYGGTCFPRDVDAFISFSRENNLCAKHMEFSLSVNEYLQSELNSYVDPGKKIGILGLSFKPSSPVTVASPSVSLIEYSRSIGVRPLVYDLLEESYLSYKGDYSIAESAQTCVDLSDVVFVMHPSKEFTDLDFSGKKVINLWKNL